MTHVCQLAWMSLCSYSGHFYFRLKRPDVGTPKDAIHCQKIAPEVLIAIMYLLTKFPPERSSWKWVQRNATWLLPLMTRNWWWVYLDSRPNCVLIAKAAVLWINSIPSLIFVDLWKRYLPVKEPQAPSLKPQNILLDKYTVPVGRPWHIFPLTSVQFS